MLLAKLHNFVQKNFFLKDKIIIANLIASLFFIIGLIFLLLFKIGFKFNSSSQLFLHYNIYFGIDWIGNWYKIYIYPFAGLLIFVINFLLAIYFYENDKIASYLLAGSATFCQIIIFISGSCAIWINS